MYISWPGREGEILKESQLEAILVGHALCCNGATWDESTSSRDLALQCVQKPRDSM